jgi:hypothetical protein
VSTSSARRNRRLCARHGHPDGWVKLFEDRLYCTACETWLPTDRAVLEQT